MLPTRFSVGAVVAVVATVLALGSALPTRSADGHPFGVTEILADADGSVASYTVTRLGPSFDPIRRPVAGRLFEATMTVEATRGSVTPAVSMFFARAAGGLTYRVLAEATTAHGLSREPLREGERATGRIYFDVVGDTPNSVVCNNGMADLMVWVGQSERTPAPAPAPPRNPTIPVMLDPDSTVVPA